MKVFHVSSNALKEKFHSASIPLGKGVLKICSKFKREHPCRSGYPLYQKRNETSVVKPMVSIYANIFMNKFERNPLTL